MHPQPAMGTRKYCSKVCRLKVCVCLFACIFVCLSAPMRAKLKAACMQEVEAKESLC